MRAPDFRLRRKLVTRFVPADCAALVRRNAALTSFVARPRGRFAGRGTRPLHQHSLWLCASKLATIQSEVGERGIMRLYSYAVPNT